MAFTRLTAQALNGSYPLTGSALTFSAGDNVNGNDFIMTGAELLIIRNDDVAQQTFTLDTLANAAGRQADITAETIEAGEMKILGPFTERRGIMQSDGSLHITVSDADVMLAVVKVR